MTSNQSDYTDSSSNGRSASPAPSLYSFSSVDGRLMDNEEHRRLDLQHQIITLALGGLYPAPNLVRKALAPRPGKAPAILDVGTGSGSWSAMCDQIFLQKLTHSTCRAIDMAMQFPHCSVVGVDLAPPRVDGCVIIYLFEGISPTVSVQRSSAQLSANLGFSHYRESFDVIHARSISPGIRDFPQLLEEFAQALRPGGVVLLGDGEMQLYDEHQVPLAYAEQGTPGFSWTTRVFFAAYNAMKNRGGSIDSSVMSPTWLRAIDAFTDVGWHKIFIPIGPWRYADQRECALTEMLRDDCLRYISGMAPLLLSEGYLPESVEMMQREAAVELRELRIHVQSRWTFAWAVKKTP
ncbi:hypothetical protein GSI_13996 [Ganoderma sinense ZZ0214-1]|uniref:Methyltransferase domain-containing protein n=1 Tax=Ganoderma sinense ZZ0214-1 TaxID=1077348 RepID=A0A2G8RRW8_9APHY|nr:hypothetical protein GSI_13996 [Ganoderma sinense ZZ0214-1]